MLARRDRLDYVPIPTPGAVPGPHRPGEWIARYFDNIIGSRSRLYDRAGPDGRGRGRVPAWSRSSSHPNPPGRTRLTAPARARAPIR